MSRERAMTGRGLCAVLLMVAAAAWQAQAADELPAEDFTKILREMQSVMQEAKETSDKAQRRLEEHRHVQPKELLPQQREQYETLRKAMDNHDRKPSQETEGQVQEAAFVFARSNRQFLEVKLSELDTGIEFMESVGDAYARMSDKLLDLSRLSNEHGGDNPQARAQAQKAVQQMRQQARDLDVIVGYLEGFSETDPAMQRILSTLGGHIEAQQTLNVDFRRLSDMIDSQRRDIEHMAAQIHQALALARKNRFDLQRIGMIKAAELMLMRLANVLLGTVRVDEVPREMRRLQVETHNQLVEFSEIGREDTRRFSRRASNPSRNKALMELRNDPTLD